jgi:hypothetical protein
MTARAPLVLGSDGLPTQLQSGDTLSGIQSGMENVECGTTSAPGTGAFTPNAAAMTGARPWSQMPIGPYLVRFEEGSAFELTFAWWNGTTLTRSSTQVYYSSTGSPLTLTTAATAALSYRVLDFVELQRKRPTRWWSTFCGSTTAAQFGITAATLVGTVSGGTFATTNYLTEQNRLILTSATTASAWASVGTTSLQATINTTAGAGRGGYVFETEFGCSALPTSPRMFMGMTSSSVSAIATDPSALVAHYAAFSLDAADTNIQLLTNSNASTGTKINTAIPLAANGWYYAAVWTNPGDTKVQALLIRMDTGAIFYTTTTADVPTTGATLMPFMQVGLNGTNTGTAVAFNWSYMRLNG